MASITVFTLVGCKKTSLGTDDALTTEELKDYETSIKAQIAALPYMEKLPTQIYDVNIPITTFLADENNNPLGASTNTAPAACNFTIPAYCNLVQYARLYDCNATTSATDGGYFLQFTYELSWDNSIYTKTSKGYLKIYDAATNALVVNQIITHFNKIDITDLGADPFNNGNNIYRVVFTSYAAVPITIINAGAAYNVYTSALFGTTSSNGTNYLVGSAPVTSSNFTGASGNDPCKRNDKVFCLLAGPGGPNNTYSASIAVITPLGACNGYNSTFVTPDVIEGQYSLHGGTPGTFLNNLEGFGNNSTGLIPYNSPSGWGYFMSSPSLQSGNYNLVFRYRNWKYTSTNWFSSFPNATPPSGGSGCVNVGNPNEPGSGYTYFYYGNISIP